MPGAPSPSFGPAWAPYLIMAAFMGLALLRGSRRRDLSVNRLWIMPTVLLVGALLLFSQQAAPSPVMFAVHIAALALGAFVGWWRGRLTHIEVDEETGRMTSRSSPLGMALLAGLVMVRYAARDLISANAERLHVTAIDIADAFLLFALGLVCVQRLEMWLRAKKITDGKDLG
ncbi:MAG TPA: CcdC protein domain-containing protein [Phenylobacterium sp.]|nr:CcdC protein domain-containing protein [Phenylobacterium sp.]